MAAPMDIIANIKANVSNFMTGIKQARDELSKMKHQTQEGMLTLQSLFNTFMMFGGLYAGRSLLENTLGSAAEFERYQLSFEVLYQSADAAKLKMKELWDYAAKTPFQMDEVVRAGMILENFGLASSKYISQIGDLSAAFPGKKIYEVAMALGRLQSGDFGEAFERFRDFGISRKDLEERGLKFDKNNVYQGNSQDAVNAVMEVIKDKFPNMSERLGKTLQGRWSTLLDMLKGIGREFSGSLFEKTKNWLELAINGLERMQKNGQLDVWAARVNYWIGKIAEGSKDFVVWLWTVAQTIHRNWSTLEPIIKGVAFAFITSRLATSRFGVEVIKASKGVFGLAEALWALLIARDASKATSRFGVEVIKTSKGVFGLAKALWALLIARDVSKAIRLLTNAIVLLESSTGVGIILALITALMTLILYSDRARAAIYRFCSAASQWFKGLADSAKQNIPIIGGMLSSLATMASFTAGMLADVFKPQSLSDAEQKAYEDKYLADKKKQQEELARLLDQNSAAYKAMMKNANNPGVSARLGNGGGKGSKSGDDIVDLIEKAHKFAIESAKLRNERRLLDDQLSGFDEDSYKYQEDKKKGLTEYKNELQKEVDHLLKAIPKLSGEVREKAWLKVWEVQKEIKEVLLDIKKNTENMVGEFNQSGAIKTLTLFGSRANQAGWRQLSIAKANFVFQVKQIQTKEDLLRMLRLIQSGLTGNLWNEVIR